MSVRIISTVFERSEATHAARLVLIALADNASDDGIAWPTQETLAHKARLSKRAVADAISELVSKNEIEVRKAQVGRRRVNVYRVLLDAREPDYERLPFKLNEPFSRDADFASRGESDDVQTSPSRRAGSAHPSIEPSLKPSDARIPNGMLASVPRHFDPTKITLVDGLNLGFDALADECSIDQKSPRRVEVGIALNGRQRHPEAGIRSLFFGELEQWAGDPETAEGRERLYNVHQALISDPTRFEHAVARAIHEKAAKYRGRMPDDAFITPTALAKWWLDLERMGERSGGLTVSDMLRFDG